MTAIKRAFIGADDKLRPIWRALLFIVASYFVLSPILDWLFQQIAQWLHLRQALSPGAIALGEFENFLLALVCTGAFAVYERRRVDSYGLTINRALSRQTLEGAVAGILMAGGVAAGMILLGGMQIRGLAVVGETLAAYALAWLGANICVGIAEEFWFRSYFQQTLWKAIGFWPSAAVIALLFAAIHYFFKSGENIWDVITLVSLSMLLSYTMLRTGTLWFAVGFHIAFDYMQLFVIGTPNGALIPVGRLLNVRFHGPAWLTGGVLGTEASFLMYPAIALLWLYVWYRYRANPPLKV
jgi:membrane protease YdiL (CAAX protease family)